MPAARIGRAANGVRFAGGRERALRFGRHSAGRMAGRSRSVRDSEAGRPPPLVACSRSGALSQAANDPENARSESSAAGCCSVARIVALPPRVTYRSELSVG